MNRDAHSTHICMHVYSDTHLQILYKVSCIASSCKGCVDALSREVIQALKVGVHHNLLCAGISVLCCPFVKSECMHACVRIYTFVCFCVLACLYLSVCVFYACVCMGVCAHCART